VVLLDLSTHNTNTNNNCQCHKIASESELDYGHTTINSLINTVYDKKTRISNLDKLQQDGGRWPLGGALVIPINSIGTR